eukprot:TRINITY_DN25160_c0_g1_i1.p1 TRINITY_DN25160_c0_g1~~TRINITY_DN25160_c0_g1_i1.p1  ORF type:complete len:170 (-),score=53.82 TRINITY_DN25160_c0_g1_i1:33-488(-)
MCIRDRLSGVVIHDGIADFGHYYSFIRGEDRRWYEFNDKVVTPIQQDRITKDGYGHNEKLEEELRFRTAYILVYTRESKSNHTPSKLERPHENGNSMETEAEGSRSLLNFINKKSGAKLPSLAKSIVPSNGLESILPVSYTHLTLPTIYSV